MQALSCTPCVTPTAIASWPIPENHLLSFPCRIRRSLFSSINRGRRIASYRARRGVSSASVRLDAERDLCGAVIVINMGEEFGEECSTYEVSDGKSKHAAMHARAEPSIHQPPRHLQQHNSDQSLP